MQEFVALLLAKYDAGFDHHDRFAHVFDQGQLLRFDFARVVVGKIDPRGFERLRQRGDFFVGAIARGLELAQACFDFLLLFFEP